MPRRLTPFVFALCALTSALIACSGDDADDGSDKQQTSSSGAVGPSSSSGAVGPSSSSGAVGPSSSSGAAGASSGAAGASSGAAGASSGEAGSSSGEAGSSSGEVGSSSGGAAGPIQAPNGPEGTPQCDASFQGNAYKMRASEGALPFTGGAPIAGTYNLVDAWRDSGIGGSMRETLVLNEDGTFTRARQLQAREGGDYGPATYRAGTYSVEGDKMKFELTCGRNGAGAELLDTANMTFVYLPGENGAQPRIVYGGTGLAFFLERAP